ncbi:MAG: hypothetical protein ACLQLH_01205 [Terracidiphilus sp.]
MTGLQAQIRGDGRRKPGALPAATVVCLFLMALLAVVQVAHLHTLESDADHCPLCIVMHSAAPVAVAAPAVVLVKIEAHAPVYEARAVVRHWNPKLFTRPPPAG